MMDRCVIVGGADINNYEYIRSTLRQNDYVIFCDSGLKHLEALRMQPGLIVGDFDSHDNPHLTVTCLPLIEELADPDSGQARFLKTIIDDKQAVHFLENQGLTVLDSA